MKYSIAPPLLISTTLLCSCGSSILSKLNKAANLKQKIYSVYQSPSLNCKEAINQYHELLELKQKYHFEVLSDYNVPDTAGLREVGKINEEDKLLQAIKIDSTCIDAYKLLGDIRAISLTQSDSLREEAIKWYSTGLRFDSTNAELKLRIAYVYDIFDSIALARKYYDMIELDSVKTETINGYAEKLISVKNILHKFDHADSLAVFFDQNKDSSYILLRRVPTYTFGTPPTTYCKIWANGRTEYHDYFGDSESPIHLETTIPDSQISTLLGLLMQIRFFSLYNLFKPDYPIAADFDYVSQWHLPNYFVTYHTPNLSHEVSVYGLGTIYGENSLRDVPSVTYNSALNLPSSSRISKKLGVLSEFWSRAFSSKVVSAKILELHGEYLQPVYGPKNYVYAKDESAFLRIALPSFEYVWKTPRSTKPHTTLKRHDPVYFLIDEILYALDRANGEIIFSNKVDLEEFPYFSINYEKFYTGKIVNNLATLNEYDSKSGRQKARYQSSSNQDGYEILLGEKPNENEKKRIAREFEALRNYYKVEH